MKITIDGTMVEFEPETQSEAMELELLVKTMGSGLVYAGQGGLFIDRAGGKGLFYIF